MSGVQAAVLPNTLTQTFVNSHTAEARDERARRAGPSDPKHLRLVADYIADEAYYSLAGVDAERLRLLAAKLEDDDDEIASLRAHSDALHRALCDATEDLSRRDKSPVVFVFRQGVSAFETALTPDEFSDLAIFLLDETE